MALPRSNIAAVAVVSSEIRRPESFLAKFPDGGKAQIVREQARISIIDIDRAETVAECVIPRPQMIRSEFGARLEGWAGEGARLYLELNGKIGETSDTARVSEWYVFNRLGSRCQPVKDLPLEIVSAKNGKLDESRQLVWWVDYIAVKQSGDVPVALRLVLDPITGRLEPSPVSTGQHAE